MEHTAKEVVSLLNKNGFQETRITGDHHRFIDNIGHRVTVPYSRPKDVIRPSTYNSILKQAGLK